MTHYREMLKHIHAVTRNECTDALSNVLETISAGGATPDPSSTQYAILGQMYDITLDTLKSSNNDRLWFNTNLKIGKFHLNAKDYPLVDRKNGMYKQIVQTQLVQSTLDLAPTIAATVLRGLVKPLVDDALGEHLFRERGKEGG